MSIAEPNVRFELYNHDHFFNSVVVAKLRIASLSIFHIALIVRPIFNCGYHGVGKRMMPFLFWDPSHWFFWYPLTSGLDASRRKEWLLSDRFVLRFCSISNPAVVIAQCLWSRFGSSSSEPICFDHPLKKNLGKCFFLTRRGFISRRFGICFWVLFDIVAGEPIEAELNTVALNVRVRIFWPLAVNFDTLTFPKTVSVSRLFECPWRWNRVFWPLPFSAKVRDNEFIVKRHFSIQHSMISCHCRVLWAYSRRWLMTLSCCAKYSESFLSVSPASFWKFL